MEKTLTNEKAKSNKKLELDYSLYLESMYVILYLVGLGLVFKGRIRVMIRVSFPLQCNNLLATMLL